MKYEYNGNLKEEDRINLVVNEIVSKYNFISIDKAKQIAFLEGKISSRKNIDMQFNRLYNIMLVINDKKCIRFILKDLIQLLEINKDNDKIDYFYNIVLEIIKFLNGEREFPYLNEF